MSTDQATQSYKHLSSSSLSATTSERTSDVISTVPKENAAMLSAFEKLPAELRIRIYEEVLPSGKFLVPCHPKMRYGLYPTVRISSILATNRNIHADAGAYLYGNNTVDLDSTFAGHVGRPTSTWRRFGPSIQHIEISVTVDIIDAFHAVFYGQPLELDELENLWQWEKNLMDGIASTGLKSLAIDTKAYGGPRPWKEEKKIRMGALVGMLERSMKNLVIERLTLEWLEISEDGSDFKEETTELEVEGQGDTTKSRVKRLALCGMLDITEAQAALAVLGR